MSKTACFNSQHHYSQHKSIIGLFPCEGVVFQCTGLYNSDGDFLIVPQTGVLHITTEFGKMHHGAARAVFDAVGNHLRGDKHLPLEAPEQLGDRGDPL